MHDGMKGLIMERGASEPKVRQRKIKPSARETRLVDGYAMRVLCARDLAASAVKTARSCSLRPRQRKIKARVKVLFPISQKTKASGWMCERSPAKHIRTGSQQQQDKTQS